MKKNKFVFLIAILLAFSLITSSTYAAVTAFYKDGDRIQLVGDLNYSFAIVDNLTVSDENLFAVTGTNARNGHVNVTVAASSKQRINFAIYFYEKGSGINYIRGQGGSKGFVASGSGSKTIRVRIRSLSSGVRTVRVAVILITLDEYNNHDIGSPINDSYTDINYTLAGSY